MSDNKTYASFAVSYELNRREFRRKLDLFPEELRYYVILANSIIGSENAKRVTETPDAVVEDGREFVSKLLGMLSAEPDDVFREILETYLVETMRDELRYCCPNCSKFNACLDIGNLPVGELFERRANGEETEELKAETTLEIEKALQRTPYIETDSAHRLCGEFSHQYSVSTIGEVFGRYSDIAAGLGASFGIDYRKVQQKMVAINMEFCERAGEHKPAG